MHLLNRSVGRNRAGKFKHAGIFLHDPVDDSLDYLNVLQGEVQTFLNFANLIYE